MKPNTKEEPSIFSFSTFVIISVLHAVSSVLLGIIAFMTGMGSFTKDVSGEMSFLTFVGWIWTPPQMLLLQNSGGSGGIGSLLLVTLVWSFVVGVAFGFVPLLRNRK